MDADAAVLLPVSDNAHVSRLVNGLPFIWEQSWHDVTINMIQKIIYMFM